MALDRNMTLLSKSSQKINWILFVFLIGLLFFKKAAAENKLEVYGGTTLSRLNTNHVHPEYGATLGLSKAWNLFAQTYFVGEVAVSWNRAVLDNKTVKPGSWYGYTQRVYDIHFNTLTVRLPVLFRQEFKVKQDLTMFFQAGGALYLLTKDGTHLELVDTIQLNLPEYDPNVPFDYRFTTTGENYSYSQSGLTFESGVGMLYKKIKFEIRYLTIDVRWAGFVRMDHQLSVFSVSVGTFF